MWIWDKSILVNPSKHARPQSTYPEAKSKCLNMTHVQAESEDGFANRLWIHLKENIFLVFFCSSSYYANLCKLQVFS